LPLARQLAVGLRDGFHTEGLHYIALKKKSVVQTVQVGFMQTWALAMSQRTWPRLHMQFKEDSYRQGADDE
jgi:hypothetical protein